MRLILFDIDGTLLECGLQGREALNATLDEVFGMTGSIDRFDFAGRTDPGIVLDVLREAGLAERDIVARIPEVREKYAARLEESLDSRRMRLLPGVAGHLEALARRKDVVLGLVTGNWEPGARTKLSRFDLNRYFDFGAFGCDGVERSDLPPVALERAERITGRRFLPEEALIVGDTIHDVTCAKAHGIPVLAVATGRTTAETLREGGADRVVADLTEIVDW
ncbi:MAG: phosphoglycolate phosphatase [Acidobacteriota bacterium]|jgi:phosphoglycolate phosphatase-like HAD superfamily hydrolase|nr:phosphoglycolate phosphatase [Acidobacteriota bacterium]